MHQVLLEFDIVSNLDQVKKVKKCEYEINKTKVMAPLLRYNGNLYYIKMRTPFEFRWLDEKKYDQRKFIDLHYFITNRKPYVRHGNFTQSAQYFNL